MNFLDLQDPLDDLNKILSDQALNLPNVEPPKYEDTFYKKMADDISCSQAEINKTLKDMERSSKTDRYINIAVLICTIVSVIISMISLLIALNS